MISFRTPDTVDLPTLNQISWQSKGFWGYPAEWMEQWRDDLTITEEILQQQSVLLAVEAQRIIGFCIISESSEYYELEHLWLLPQYIGKGYGKRLLEQSLSKFATAPKPVQVVADPNAEAFYRRQGFETFKQLESTPPGRFLPVMRRPYTKKS